jgi:hypothetical protein
MPVGASGYHSLASFHKDDNGGQPAGPEIPGCHGTVARDDRGRSEAKRAF